MLGDKQEQSAEAGSTAIQAGRDVNIHGLSVSEVRELCVLFLRNNFPQLREEAKKAAEDQVRMFAANLEARLVNDAASIVLDKFREPDVQAAINDAVQASARKGNLANPGILSALISERVAKKSNDFKDVVLSEAVQVVPRLTSPQIALLSYVHFVRSVVIQSLPSVSALEHFGQAALRFSSPAFGLSESQKQHLQYAGAALVLNILGGDVFDAQSQAYRYFGITGGAAFKAELERQAPSYHRLLEQFAADSLFTVSLTSVGQAIALANISNYLGKLDYTIWLK
jgi:hypothetical protein